MPDVSVRMGTLVDALAEAILEAAAYDPNTQSPPACVLWPDEKTEWSSLLPRLRSEWPHLLLLGEYDSSQRTGPAIWIKTAMERRLPETQWSDEDVPVVYLPGVSRSMLRNAGALPRSLQPLAELQHRGVIFSQANSKDWTVLAFLASEDGGLGLDVGRDAETVDAMSRALDHLADTPIERLIGRRLEADDFNEILAPDPILDVLKWLNDPDGFRQLRDGKQWDAFRAVCKERFRFDPQKTGSLEAAQRLGETNGPWARVWDRFIEAPHRYPQVPERLGQAKPSGKTGDLFSGVSEAWPQDNRREEEELRTDLIGLSDATQGQAVERIRNLEERHGRRRSWVWAELGEAPLASALRHLVALADAVSRPSGGTTANDLAATYAEKGWEADDAYLRSIASTSEKRDTEAVQAAAGALYRPWLEQTSRVLEEVLGDGLPPEPNFEEAEPKAGCAYVFVDGLRYDVGMRLKKLLHDDGLQTTIESRWSPFPTLTATAKPAASPVAHLVRRQSTFNDFAPETASGPLTTHRFRALLDEAGFQFIAYDETGDPSGAGWTESGTFDKRGHELGSALAYRVDDILRTVSARIRELISAGWSEVRVVTDHGWLLLSGGLPKTHLPSALTNVKWGRCAEIKGGSKTDLPTHGWYWNPDIRIAVARGIHAFIANIEYAHGGLTLQECLVPRLVVTADEQAGGTARITSVEWVGLRCRVDVEGALEGYAIDLRQHAGDAQSSVVTNSKEVDDGRASLIVPDDRLEGADAVVVLLDTGGRLKHQMKTIIGGQ